MLVYQHQAQPLSPASPLFEFPQEILAHHWLPAGKLT